MNLFLIIFFFGFSIFIHELGHLLAARFKGLYVDKFAVGFGPILLRKKIKNIDFSLRLFPLGGFVSIPSIDFLTHKNNSASKKIKMAGPWDRIFVAFAGPLFNMIFAFFL